MYLCIFLGSKEFVAPFVTHWVPLLPHEEMAQILKSILSRELYIYIYMFVYIQVTHLVPSFLVNYIHLYIYIYIYVYIRYAFSTLVPLLPHEEMKQILKNILFREFI